MKVTFLGLGGMGVRMAANIQRAGHALTVWNRSSDKATALAEAGATVAATPRAAVADAEIVVAMLLDDAASLTVWADPETGAFGGMAADALAVDCSTISLAATSRLADAAGAAGLGFLSAPVAGTLQPAESGDLVIIAGGDPALVERARPVFEAIGKETRHAGDPVAAMATKLLINGMLCTQETALAELLGMLQRLGVDHRVAFDILCATPVASSMLKTYGQLMIDGTDAVNFPLRSLLKDVGLMLAAGEQAGAPLPVVSGAMHSVRAAADAGLIDRNQTELLRHYEP